MDAAHVPFKDVVSARFFVMPPEYWHDAKPEPIPILTTRQPKDALIGVQPPETSVYGEFPTREAHCNNVSVFRQLAAIPTGVNEVGVAGVSFASTTEQAQHPNNPINNFFIVTFSVVHIE